MREIFDLQWQLNIHTLRNIGKDFVATVAHPDDKLIWIENYRKALSAEVAELIREVRENGLGTHNGKIEVVDMLHFLVSLSHILHIMPAEVSIDPTTPPPKSFDDCAIRIFLALDDLQNSLKWKWWAKGGGFKEYRARAALMDVWKCMDGLCALFGLDFPTVKNIYIAKNKVNFERQNNGYNEDTKTEADNLGIRT